MTLAFRALPPLIPTCAISLVTNPVYGVPMVPLNSTVVDGSQVPNSLVNATDPFRFYAQLVRSVREALDLRLRYVFERLHGSWARLRSNEAQGGV